METKRMICFDMDGTIADLYGVPDWHTMLCTENPTPYLIAKPMWDMTQLNDVLNKLINQGWEIRIISWLAKDSSEAYKQAVRIAKIEWLKTYRFPYQKCHLIAYGTTKADAIRRVNLDRAILIDDTKKIRDGWRYGETINPQEENVIEKLEALL